jgi:hypothetical protein
MNNGTMRKIKIMGMVAAVLVLGSLMLPWMSVTIDPVVGDTVTDSFTGLEIYEDQDSDARFYPVLAIVASALSLLLFYFHRGDAIFTILGVLVGLAVVASALLVYNDFLQLEGSNTFFTTTVSMAYGMYLAIIGGIGIAGAAVWGR